VYYKLNPPADFTEQVPPNYKRPTQSAVGSFGGSGKDLLFFFVFCAAIAWCGGLEGYEFWLISTLKSSGLTAQAKAIRVVEINPPQTGKNPDLYRVTYQFVAQLPDGRTQVVVFTKGTRNIVAVGSLMPIIYDPRDPKNYLPQSDTNFNKFCCFCWLQLLFLFGALLFLDDFLSLRKLKQTGLTAPGVIVELWQEKHKNISYLFAYQFTVSGNSFGVRQSVDKRKYDTLQVGDTVTVRYLPTDPTKSRAEF